MGDAVHVFHVFDFRVFRRHNRQAWIEDERLYIQTELCETSLEKQLESGHRLEIDGVYAFLRQTLLGLEILHQHKLVHLDIKVQYLLIAQAILNLFVRLALGESYAETRWSRPSFHRAQHQQGHVLVFLREVGGQLAKSKETNASGYNSHPPPPPHRQL